MTTMRADDAAPSLAWIAASALPLAVLEGDAGTAPDDEHHDALTHRWVNDAYAALCGRPAEELVGRPWSNVFGEQEPAAARSTAPIAPGASRAASGAGAHPVLAVQPPDDRGTRWVWAALTPRPAPDAVRDDATATADRDAAAADSAAEGASSWWLLQLVDVTSEHAEYTRLRHRATHDTVTGLVNRVQFVEHVEQALRRLQRAPRRHAAVLFLDLDRVKHVNDAYGHAAGDHVIVTTAERLRDAVRPSDVVARLGGDEYTVLLEDLHDDPEAEVSAIVERCLAAVSQPIDIGRQQTRVTASVGIALATPESSADDLLAAADAAMYHAKRAGRGRARYADTHRPRHLSPRAALERQLYGALGRGELRVHYQPVIDLTTGTVSAAEALLRWQHPEHGLLPAGAFIDIATDAGLIGDIGSWVCSQSTSDLRGWDRQGARLDTLLLNIAGEQIVDDTLADQLRGCLTANDLDPSRICLEITETEISSSAATLQRLHELHDLGCVLAVDDFGTGYSSLSRLIDLPVDVVKIDRSFIADVGSDPRPTAVVSATLLMAHDLHQSVIAEGVENRDQHRWLQEAGCTHAQGHLLARPMPADELPRLL